MTKHTVDRLRDCLLYDPSTGFFTWKISLSVRAPSGRKAGWKMKNGYVMIGFDGT
jgi:hypothetical protein